jgi:hypothetical protein
LESFVGKTSEGKHVKSGYQSFLGCFCLILFSLTRIGKKLAVIDIRKCNEDCKVHQEGYEEQYDCGIFHKGPLVVNKGLDGLALENIDALD